MKVWILLMHFSYAGYSGDVYPEEQRFRMAYHSEQRCAQDAILLRIAAGRNFLKPTRVYCKGLAVTEK